ncbi:hypothetical protein Hamer_G005830 [Homarus americanus]|uniref:Uncharacterized protein n=1 Tax=Homarus americanus TaxID=6706 RepID=A0A8J5JFW0_HOMAM|nr:hypothetical protein Hamer_G005830 [Homarus americanus]
MTLGLVSQPAFTLCSLAGRTRPPPIRDQVPRPPPIRGQAPRPPPIRERIPPPMQRSLVRTMQAGLNLNAHFADRCS